MSHADFLGVFQGGNYEDQNIVDFLKMIWDLPAMPSEDPRFKNAEADARQHLINNDDWDLTYTFEQRFNLLAGDTKHFIKFVEACVSPFVRVSSEEIMQYVEEITFYNTSLFTMKTLKSGADSVYLQEGCGKTYARNKRTQYSTLG